MLQKLLLILILFSVSVFSVAQKKPLDHSVYDGWQSIDEKKISNDGKWIIYTVDPQEGDNELLILSTDKKYLKKIPRAYNASFSEDNRFVIFKIKPFYKDIRTAKIKKKKPDDFPKDSLGIIELGKDSIWKTARVKNYKTAGENYKWIAYLVEKKQSGAIQRPADSKKTADSLSRIIDSLEMVINELSAKKKRNKDDELINAIEEVDRPDAGDDDNNDASSNILTDLVLRNMETGKEITFLNVTEFLFNKEGNKLLIEKGKNKNILPCVLLYDFRKGFADTLSKGGNDFKRFAMTDDGLQVAYMAERDTGQRTFPKLYKIWYYKEGMDSAVLLVDKNSGGMKLGMTVSSYSRIDFSKSGKRLFFSTEEMPIAEDTSLADIDKVKLDIWHYNDDYLQTFQLDRLKYDSLKSFLAVYLFETNTVHQLASEKIPVIYQTNQGDGETFVGVSDFGKRIESQWTGTTLKDIYAINVDEGSSELIKNDLSGNINSSYISPGGKYIMWYDNKAKDYFVWDGGLTKNISEKISTPLFDEEHDTPNEPPPYGVMGWQEGDAAVYIYDRYDIWKIDPRQDEKPLNITRQRENKNQVRYVRTDPEKRFLKENDLIALRTSNEEYKMSGYNLYRLGAEFEKNNRLVSPAYVSGLIKAKDAASFVYSFESYQLSPNLRYAKVDPDSAFTLANHLQNGRVISSTNPQQKDYNWGTAELFEWKAYNGKMSEGIIYKPEDFDPKKKYPMICYFYETLSDGLFRYISPAPTPSRLNISFFVSRGYVVFAPDIHYSKGNPGKDAYNYVLSGARAIVKKGFVDSTRIGIQGQSWGGYQVAYLITATNFFKAAWAGAPVANMTSAYGGIRWESGVNRQFQYERTQSRIGATLWEKPELYIENSPLFRLPKVRTPLVIMSNDKDGAVPWYQGIELFTAMRRLDKKVWLLNYNGEAHNLVERKNRKDISIREQQYFDWLLKGEQPAKWISEGLPATKKGKDWGLELVD